MLKVSWFLQVKYNEYVKSKNRKTYQLRDIVASVNLILLKDNNRSVTKRTIQEDIKNL
ncbi:plasmid maintenance protein [Borreliella garinii]|uniref:plasmid maintenance protein n=1 Tax=Borreliella garinii TaxID=29519 RepID=UPI001AEDD20F|nr:plasmid maintenance protein [Borreliella garinii]